MSTLSTTNLKNPSSGSNNIVLDSSGRVLVGTSSARNAGYADPAQVQIEGLGYNSAAQSIIIDSNDTNGPSLNFGKSRGTSLNSNTVVQSGDRLGVIDFAGADGTSLKRGAVIEAYVDGTPGANDMPGRLVFSTTADGTSSPTERMRIRNNGDIDFNGGVAAGWTTSSGGLRIGASATYGVELSNSRPSSGTATQNFLANYHNGTYIGGINTSTTATSFPTSSDYRLKENVAPVSEAVARLQALKPCEFNFKSEPAQRITGFLAHEVQEVLPNAVDGEKDAVDPNGSIKTQCLDHSKLVPLLTAALQEAIAKIESLETRLSALEAA